MKQTIGIVIFVFGTEYHARASALVRSVRCHSRGRRIPITIIGDAPVEPCNFIEVAEPHGLCCKPLLGHLSPYDVTLYLDADTVILSPRAWLPFRLLRRKGFDVAASHARRCDWRRHCDVFPRLSSGVIFAKRPAADLFFQRWRLAYGQPPPDGRRGKSTQYTMSDTLRDSPDIRTVTLLPEYNYCPAGGERYLSSPDQIVILHHRDAHKHVGEDGSLCRGWLSRRFWGGLGGT